MPTYQRFELVVEVPDDDLPLPAPPAETIASHLNHWFGPWAVIATRTGEPIHRPGIIEGMADTAWKDGA